MDEERELYVFTDEDGNEITMQALHYFYYNGEEYAVMAEADDEADDEANDEADDACCCEDEACCACGCEDECEDEDCDCDGTDIFFMKVVPVEGSEDDVEFVPVEDEALMDELFNVINSEFDGDDGKDEQ